jgi:capsular exopolysaccharide synthesis family protein
MTLIMALLAGCCFAVGAVFLFELADDRIVAPEDVRRRLGQPLLALIPRTRSTRVDQRVSLLTTAVPTSTLEAFRALRTSVISMMSARSARSVLVTSASAGEGKTHVASNLAIALSQAQHRVLLIDADTRRSTLHTVFGRPGEAGLSDLLKGEATLKDVLRASSQPGLTVLGCGSPTTEAPELLGSSAFGQLMAILEEHFTWVVIDTPPALALADASLLASHAAAIVLVVGCGRTRARAARLALEELRKVGANVIGAVLNNADAKRHPYYFSETTTRTYSLARAETGQAPV